MAKRALLIGINAYQSVRSLQGCVNDITNLRLILKEQLGYTNEEIRVLIDSRATKGAIEERLAWLVSGAKRGDLLVLHFSGHGSQVRDRDEQDELSDQLDEILCPWDMDWDSKFITDDYLTAQLRVPAGVTLEVILDCCNSGDATLELGFPRPAVGGNPDRQPRFLQPPVDIVARHEGDLLPRKTLFSAREKSNLALWSACAAFQTAADASFDGVANGAFTFFLCKHLREAPGLSRTDLLTRVRSSLDSSGFTQRPELAAPPKLSSAQAFKL